ncbi:MULTISPECIES: ABC transporter substrate-binding protein [Marivita]|uniref:ABC transporter substrate-binding protein n=1 Tax=Marivita cryptomonadis TaxID=505252 RepID=A0A9Q2NVJ7_9RHOB|nr:MULTISPECIES: ABC transporter substrate-binding protein [Marivita]MCR9170595.1 ABC transporter substrate-binding protein [Paracoccaceae bacterium]MBM2322045.1 ABC transporter substrate-binding protein [Marivita cryptomonadis]MBM2331626.1 ABC transporter substrate-binding protein [Marivita cryptomonadis]MBM2341211.1 ABC transporter substrate-binding protein [Marivita cryptomonadis]MBM2345874.1 ABC transporter substrate-binding protein [Marivita cryptomonadis]
MFNTRLTCAIASAVALCLASAATAQVDVAIHYLKQVVDAPPTLSNLDPIPEDLGIRGAELGAQENNTTGKFLGQTYSLIVTEVFEGEDFAEAARAALAETDLLVLDAPTAQLLAAADLPEAKAALLFNAGAADVALRDETCRARVLHALPSYAMKADALMQFFVTRRWDEIALIAGERPEDQAWAETLERSARKFGLKFGARKTWAFDADMRRNAAQEVPLFTQDLGDYDVLLVADAADDFARYISYNTWRPRPVAGSEGLRAVTWHRVVEQWGAAQLQSRFTKLADRPMLDRDYAAWAAVRAIGEAVTRTGAADAETLRSFMLSDAFELAGFKGSPLTFRTWNGQLRQPIPLVHERALVAQAPLEGFLHQRNELDTLGLDQPESGCTAFEN